jgi:hypothetical protein
MGKVDDRTTDQVGHKKHKMSGGIHDLQGSCGRAVMRYISGFKLLVFFVAIKDW